MKEVLLQAIGVEAYNWYQGKHPKAGIIRDIHTAYCQFMFPAQDRVCRMITKIEDDYEREELAIPDIIERITAFNERTSKLASNMIRLQDAKPIDLVNYLLVCGVGLTAIGMNLDVTAVLATAALTKVLANSAVHKFYT